MPCCIWYVRACVVSDCCYRRIDSFMTALARLLLSCVSVAQLEEEGPRFLSRAIAGVWTRMRDLEARVYDFAATQLRSASAANASSFESVGKPCGRTRGCVCGNGTWLLFGGATLNQFAMLCA